MNKLSEKTANSLMMVFTTYKSVGTSYQCEGYALQEIYKDILQGIGIHFSG